MITVPRYRPPEGYYDQPFSWIFEDTSITSVAGQSLNNKLRIQAGYGDFVCRRIAGLGNFVPAPTGKWQLRDWSGNYLQSDVMYVSGGSDEFACPWELLYPEKSQIRFDLYGISSSSLLTPRRQICFQGVRRVHGTMPKLVPDTPYNPKDYTYTVVQQFTTARTLNIVQKITDFDFDLYEVRFTVDSALNNAYTRVWMQDAVKGYISNIPMLDCFLNGAPNASNIYQQGALVPPLLYPKRFEIRLEMTPIHSSLLPFTTRIQFRGRNRIPC